METKCLNAEEITSLGMNNLCHNYGINLGMIKNYSRDLGAMAIVSKFNMSSQCVLEQECYLQTWK